MKGATIKCENGGLIISGACGLWPPEDRVTIATTVRPLEIVYRGPLPIAITALDESTFLVEQLSGTVPSEDK
jgi:hypothetical protein